MHVIPSEVDPGVLSKGYHHGILRLHFVALRMTAISAHSCKRVAAAFSSKLSEFITRSTNPVS
jgi:hypothetical protein